jgi:hypothetical protein
MGQRQRPQIYLHGGGGDIPETNFSFKGDARRAREKAEVPLHESDFLPWRGCLIRIDEVSNFSVDFWGVPG